MTTKMTCELINLLIVKHGNIGAFRDVKIG
jgi:hypothetical protein